MNIHVPQNPLARAEAYMLMLTTKNILTGQKNAPIIGPIQDSLLGGFCLTDKRCMIEWEDAMNLVYQIDKVNRWSSLLYRAEEFYPEYLQNGRAIHPMCPGRVLASILFPDDFNYTRTNGVDKEEPDVIIEKGVWIAGEGNKDVFGGKAKSIVHELALRYSYEVAGDFIDAYQFLSVPYITRKGFSIGIMDLRTENATKIRDELSSVNVACKAIIESEKDPDRREQKINNVLNGATNIGRVLADDGLIRGKDNAITVMHKSGSKGNHINASQMLALVGQQNVKGERIPKVISNGKRSLPCFTIEEADTPTARGFVSSCYVDGLNPWETFFHAESGREGVINTSVSTADTGYIERQIGKKLENVVVWDDLTIRDGSGRICQMIFDRMGLNPKRLCYPEGGNGTPLFTNPIAIAKRLNIGMDPESIQPLTSEDIDVVLKDIVYPGEENERQASKYAGDTARSLLRPILEKVMVSTDPGIRSLFHDTIVADYKNAIVLPGDAVGMFATLSIGEPTTQSCLSYFHSAGIMEKNITLGVPKINEILHVTKKPKTPSCIVYFNNPHVDGSESKKVECYLKTKSMGRVFEYVRVQDLLSGDPDIEYLDDEQPEASAAVELLFGYKKHVEEWWECTQKDRLEPRNATSYGDWVLTLQFDVKKLYYYNIKLKSIASKIERATPGDVYCLYSPMAIGKIVVYIDYSTTVEPAVNKLKLKDGLLTAGNINYFYIRDVVVVKIREIYLQGIKGIEKVFPTCFQGVVVDKSVVKGEIGEWYVETQGSNLRDILANPSVDKTRTISDNIWEIHKCLGFGAAREFLAKEFNRILTADGTYIHPSHIEILVDTMCRKREPTSTDRHGIDNNVGPMAKASYEETIKNFAKAAGFGEVDDMTSLSAQISSGKLVKVGCGFYK